MLSNIHVFNIIIWLTVGIAIGLLSSLVFSDQAKGGKITTIILSVVGALTGGLLSSRYLSFNVTSINTESGFAALSGAVILSLVHRFIFKEKHLIRTRVTNFTK